jgi:hypothetical protein
VSSPFARSTAAQGNSPQAWGEGKAFGRRLRFGLMFIDSRPVRRLTPGAAGGRSTKVATNSSSHLRNASARFA